jgi:phosphoserine phosphatase
MPRICCTVARLAIVLLAQGANAGDPLPSWTNGAAKSSIIEYVEQAVDPQDAGFVPPKDRIAVFDNDGTLWPENPVPFQLAFAIDSLHAEAPSHPEWASDPAVQAALAGSYADLLTDGHKGLIRVLALTHAGMTTEEFDTLVARWIETAKHPRFGRRYDECVYQPMLELLAYLRANGFETWIVSGGGSDFMRVWSERVYGVPARQVIGSYGLTKYELISGKPALLKTTEGLFIDDKAGKPAAIHRVIAQRPVMAFGNSDGDLPMLEYVTVGNPLPSLGLIVHHTDADREYAYDAAPTSSGRLVRALADAPKRGWEVVDMATDFRRMFAFEALSTTDRAVNPKASP